MINECEVQKMKVLFTDCWVGCYVGEGEYEGGCCPDILITGVPTFVDESDLFSYYLMGLCDGFCDHDKIEYKCKVVKRQSTKRVPVKITSKEELDDCNEEFIEVFYNDLIDWIDEYFED
jgi:hypothetical protein